MSLYCQFVDLNIVNEDDFDKSKPGYFVSTRKLKAEKINIQISKGVKILKFYLYFYDVFIYLGIQVYYYFIKIFINILFLLFFNKR